MSSFAKHKEKYQEIHGQGEAGAGALQKQGTERRRAVAKEQRSLKRKGALAKRRNVGGAAGEGLGSQQLQRWTEADVQQAMEALTAAGGGQDRVQSILAPLTAVRRLLSVQEQDPPIDELLERGLLQRLLVLLNHPDDGVQLEVVWCLTNIASGESSHTKMVLEALPRLLQLVESDNPPLVEHVLWALGNIAGDSDECRDVLLRAGAMQPLCRQLTSFNQHLKEQNQQQQQQQQPSQAPKVAVNAALAKLAATAAWALSNLSRGHGGSGKPFLESGVLPTLLELLAVCATASPTTTATTQGQGQEAVAEAAQDKQQLALEVAWVFTFLTAREEDVVTTLLEMGLVQSLLQALQGFAQDDFRAGATPVLRALGNVVSGPDEWINFTLSLQDPAFLPLLVRLLQLDQAEFTSAMSSMGASDMRKAQQHQQHGRALLKEAAWVASNIASGSPAAREALIAAGAVPQLIRLLLSGQFDLEKEAAFGLWNLASADASPGADVARQLVEQEGMLRAFIGLLRVPDPAAVKCALSFVRLVCDKVPQGPQLVESMEGIDALDNLHYGQVDPLLAGEAAAMVDKFFGEDYGGEEQEAEEQGGTPFPDAAAAAPGRGMGRGRQINQPAWMKG